MLMIPYETPDNTHRGITITWDAGVDRRDLVDIAVERVLKETGVKINKRWLIKEGLYPRLV